MSKYKTVCRPSGYKGKMSDNFLLKSSVYGQKYFCTKCGKETLGTNFRIDSFHHHAWCERLKEVKEATP